MTSPFTAPAAHQPTGVKKIESVEEKTIGVPVEVPAGVELDTSFGLPEEFVDGSAPAVVDPINPTGKAGKPRTPKGFLEARIKEVTDAFSLGEIEVPEGRLTAHQISLAIKANYPDAKRTSQGAVSACLGRWEKVGFIETALKPYRFIGYTDDAVEIGLIGLKKRRSEERKAIREAARVEERAAKRAAHEAKKAAE